MSEGPTGVTPSAPQEPNAAPGAPAPSAPPSGAPTSGAPAPAPTPQPRPAPRWGQYAPTPPPTPPAPGAPPAATGWGAPPAPAGWGAPPDPGPGYGPPPGGYMAPPGGYGTPPPAPPQGGQYGQYGQFGAPAPTGWGPSPWSPVPLAPRPGIVPLRPLSLGEIFDGAFRAIRTNPKVMFGLSAIVVTVTAILQALVTWRLFATLEPALSMTATAEDLADLEAVFGDLVAQVGLILGAQVISLAVTTVLSGLLIVSVSQSVIGRTASPGEVWAGARAQVWRLLVLTLLVLLIVAAPMIVWAGLLVATIAVEQWVLTAVVGVVGGIAMLVGLLVLVTRTLLATPALMLERAGIAEALRRGWLLTRGTFWRVLGIYLLTSIIVAVVAGSITNGASLVLQLVAPDPTAVLTSPGYLVGTTLAQIVATTLTTPFTAAVTALLYIDVRMRTEGLDIELARAAEAAD